MTDYRVKFENFRDVRGRYHWVTARGPIDAVAEAMSRLDRMAGSPLHGVVSRMTEKKPKSWDFAFSGNDGKIVLTEMS